ncbi:hypothetical protein JXO52_12880 [bacterium]|nr:hypothetical protein [bacterium]
MKNIDEYKEVWKAASAEDAGFAPLSRDEMRAYLKGRSHSAGRLFRNGLVIDIALKTGVGAALLYLALVMNTPQGIDLAAYVTLGCILVLGSLQVRYLVTMPPFAPDRNNVRDMLAAIIEYYETRYRTVLFIAGGTNPLLLVTGMLYYFFFRYGGVRPLDSEDLVVFTLFLLVGYLLGVLVPMLQYRFQMNQLRECLSDLDESTFSSQKLKEQKMQRIRWIAAAVLALIAGLLLFAYLVRPS